MYVKNAEGLISNGTSAGERLARKLCVDALEAALSAADPRNMILNSVRLSRDELSVNGSRFDLWKFKRIIVLGGGKASAALAVSLESILGKRIAGGLLNVPEKLLGEYRLRAVKLHGATHPLPSEKGVRGVERMLELVASPTVDTLVICLISGGGSALMPSPREEISLTEKVRVTDLLLKAGATIRELNVVRKHLSGMKGGLLAKRLYPSTVIALVVSDVIGDPLDSIASGPLSPDPSTFRDALNVLKKYGLENKVPEGVLSILREGEAGKVPETPKPGDICFKRVHHFIIGNNRIACLGACERLKSARKNPMVLTSRLEGEARLVGEVFATIAGDSGGVGRPDSFVAGGETTVTVRGSGMGGRNQEAALAALRKIGGTPKIALAFAGSDGLDGPTDAAGAMVDGSTIDTVRSLGLDAVEYLARNDSYNFFRQTGDLIRTGPTGTNVNDVWISVKS